MFCAHDTGIHWVELSATCKSGELEHLFHTRAACGETPFYMGKKLRWRA